MLRGGDPLRLGMIWWFAGGLHEIADHTLSTQLTGVQLVFFAFSCLICADLRHRLDWRLFEWPAMGLMPAMTVMALLQMLDGNLYPSVHGGWFGWPVAICAWYLILNTQETRGVTLPSCRPCRTALAAGPARGLGDRRPNPPPPAGHGNLGRLRLGGDPGPGRAVRHQTRRAAAVADCRPPPDLPRVGMPPSLPSLPGSGCCTPT